MVLPPPHRRILRSAALLGTVALAGCSIVEPDPEVQRQQIRASLDAYLPKLGEAYATGDVEALRGLAVEKELASVHKLVSELAEQGQVLEPTLRSVTVEQIVPSSYTLAIVTTVEVWDLRSYTLGSHRLLREVTDQSNRVKYQMKLAGERWVVQYRHVVDRSGD